MFSTPTHNKPCNNSYTALKMTFIIAHYGFLHSILMQMLMQINTEHTALRIGGRWGSRGVGDSMRDRGCSRYWGIAHPKTRSSITAGRWVSTTPLECLSPSPPTHGSPCARSCLPRNEPWRSPGRSSSETTVRHFSRRRLSEMAMSKKWCHPPLPYRTPRHARVARFPHHPRGARTTRRERLERAAPLGGTHCSRRPITWLVGMHCHGDGSRWGGRYMCPEDGGREGLRDRKPSPADNPTSRSHLSRAGDMAGVAEAHPPPTETRPRLGFPPCPRQNPNNCSRVVNQTHTRLIGKAPCKKTSMNI